MKVAIKQTEDRNDCIAHEQDRRSTEAAALTEDTAEAQFTYRSLIIPQGKNDRNMNENGSVDKFDIFVSGG